jgi:iron complex outermembrane recepter protein
MKIQASAVLCLVHFGMFAQVYPADSIQAKELVPLNVTALRTSANSPFSKTTLSKQNIAVLNNGADLPILLNTITNVVSTSDAGTGIGYTGLRLRGNDITRINVTLNGVPINDAEGQGVFFVNFADVASSAQSIQVQRGVGSSTNGPGAFAGSIHINSIDLDSARTMKYMLDYSSFNTLRNTIQMYSGQLKSGFNVSARVSKIGSDGYIDRARSDLQSGQLCVQYKLNKKQNLTFNYMTGKERTYQAWNGVAQWLLDSARTFNALGQKNDGSFYTKQTDNYTQTYYQLIYEASIKNKWRISAMPYVTKGSGYYQEWRNADELKTYTLAPIIVGVDTQQTANIERQLWLDNTLIGLNCNALFNGTQYAITMGANASTYRGKHFGNVVAVNDQIASQRWYTLDATKSEASAFGKVEYWRLKHVRLYGDMQARSVTYDINGFRKSPTLRVHNKWLFLNPKVGVVLQLDPYRKYTHNIYASIAIANKEPNRDDLENTSITIVKPERLYNLELGYRLRSKKFSFENNLYYMHYRNQLIPTGKINDVGAYTRVNTPSSYRAGIELEASYTPYLWARISGNVALSTNKIKSYTEYTDDYDNGIQQATSYSNTDIAFSPGIVGALTSMVYPLYCITATKTLSIATTWKYTGKQYLDNTQNDKRILKAYSQLDVTASQRFAFNKRKSLEVHASLTNLANSLYEANGYTFSYRYGGTDYTETFLFPQAGRRYGIGLSLNL